MKVSVYIATTIDGFIASPDGSVDFLDEFQQNAAPEDGDMGFTSFLSTVDLLIMGRKTWDQVVSFGEEMWPYGDRAVWIWSRNPQLVRIPDSRKKQAFVHCFPPMNMLQFAEEKGYNHAYVDGGSTIQEFQKAGCVDEYILSRIPVLLGGGISLFDNSGDVSIQKLDHVGTKSFSNGIVQSHYRVVNG